MRTTIIMVAAVMVAACSSSKPKHEEVCAFLTEEPEGLHSIAAQWVQEDSADARNVRVFVAKSQATEPKLGETRDNPIENAELWLRLVREQNEFYHVEDSAKSLGIHPLWLITSLHAFKRPSQLPGECK